MILRHTAPPRPGHQPVHAHLPFVSAQATGKAFGQEIMPDATRAIGSIAGDKAGTDFAYMSSLSARILGARTSLA